MNKLYQASYFLFLFSLFSPTYGTITNEESQLDRDIRIVSGILKRHNNNSFACDEEYSQVGDPLIAWAQAQSDELFKNARDNQRNLKKVITLYEADKSKKLLNGLRLTWLGLQLSMALTPQDIIEAGEKNKTSETNLIRALMKKHEDRESVKNDKDIPWYLRNAGPYDPLVDAAWPRNEAEGTNLKPLWLHSFESILGLLEHHNLFPYLRTIQICHLFFQPIAVYKTGGIFTAREYINALRQGCFLYGIDPSSTKGHTVHGGIHQHCAEKTGHDMIHYYTQWFKDETEHCGNFASFQETDEYKIFPAYAHIWKTFAGALHEALESDNFRDTTEQNRLGSIGFMMLHEGLSTIPSVLDPIFVVATKVRTLADIGVRIANVWKKDTIGAIIVPDDEKGFYLTLLNSDKDWLENNIKTTREIFILNSTDMKDNQNRIASKLLKFPVEAYKIVDSKVPHDAPHKVEVRCKLKETREEERKPIQFEQTFHFSDIQNFSYLKSFYRDMAHMLIKKGLWKPEGYGEGKPVKLGNTYKFAEMRGVLEDLHQWFMEAISEGGKLHDAFSKVSVSLTQPETKDENPLDHAEAKDSNTNL